MAMLAYDNVWLREPKLMVPGKKPIVGVDINWSDPISRSLSAFAMPINRTGALHEIVSRRQGSAAYVGSVQVVSGNICSAYVARGFTAMGATESYANSLLYCADPPGGFSYCAKYYLRKDYPTIGEGADYCFRFGGTNLASSYNGLSDFVGAPPCRHQMAYDTRSWYSSFNVISGTAISSGFATSSTTANAVVLEDDKLFAETSITGIGGNESSIYVYGVADTTQPLLEYIALWNRRLSNSELLSFLRDPYRLLAPA